MRPELPDRYHLIGHMADGWSSSVWRAELRSGPARAVVVKVLKGEVNGPEGPAREGASRGLREAFGREALALAYCTGPGVPALIETLEIPQGPVIVLEEVRGFPLRDLPLVSRSRARDILDRLLGIVGRLHRRGWLHCDLNPGNVLISKRRVHLIDFGGAMPVGLPPAWCWPHGRHRFMAPEHLRGRWTRPPYTEVGPWSDVHQIACLYAWMLSGRDPFRGASDEEVYETNYLDAIATWMEQSANCKARAMGLDPDDAYDRILVGALEPERIHRSPDAETLRRSLKQVL